MIETRSTERARDFSGIYTTLSNWFEIALPGAGRLRAMEGVRGVSVILVFFVHYVGLTKSLLPEDTLTEWSGKALALLGNRGVDLFFILSGFLIYGTLIRKAHDYRKFMARRVERIYPTFLVVLAIYLVLSFAVPSESKLPSDLTAAALLLLANILLLPGIFDIEAIITVAWSLSYEFFFYLTVPALVAILGLRRWTPRSRIVLQVVTIIATVWVSAYVKAPHLRMVYLLQG
ncbi:MAG: acyltransferase [Gemmatimonadetes bacterium]|nr:acyltransferase [Gemmatimonadota bacterium]